MLKHFSLGAAILAFASFAPVSIADDGKPAQAGKNQSSASEDKPPKYKDAALAAAPAAPEALRETLKKAVKQVQAMADEAANAGRRFTITPPEVFAMRFTKEMEADVLKALGRAQALAGSIQEARATWQAALDATSVVSSLDAAADRTKLYIDIARAQNEAGEQSEARFTLGQALQATRMIAGSSVLPIDLPMPPGMEDDREPLAKKAGLLCRIARVQADTGDKAAADDTNRLALEACEGIKDPTRKINPLLEIAPNIGADAAKGLWSKALDLAEGLKEEYPRARAVETVIRARLESLPPGETLTIVADRLKGDLQNYALWVVADAIASSDKPFPPQVTARLSELAGQAKFDRALKKFKVFERIAEAQARLGDYDGAHRTAGGPEPVNNVQNFRSTQTRAHVMAAIATAQIKAKQLDAAKETVLAALEMIAPFDVEDADAYYPLGDLCLLQAQSGDLAGALHTASAVGSSAHKVTIYTEIAAAHADAGRLDEARKTLLLARDAALTAPNQALWQATHLTGANRKLFSGSEDPSLHVLQTLARGQARIGDLDAALKTVATMTSSGLGRMIRGQTVDLIVTARLDKADVAGAHRAVDVIADADAFLTSKTDLLEKIARKQAAQGDASGVLAWAERERAPKAKLQLLRGLADGAADRAAAQKPTASSPADTPKPTP